MMFPSEPMPMVDETSTASRAGGHVWAKMNIAAIRIGAQPTPISTMASVIIQGWVAMANSNAPPPPHMPRSRPVVRFGP
jgi:hypothetical protein